MSDEPAGFRRAFTPDIINPLASAEFIRGAEVGGLVEAIMAAPDEPIERIIRTDNAENALRLAEAFGRDVVSEELEPPEAQAMRVTFSPQQRSISGGMET